MVTISHSKIVMSKLNFLLGCNNPLEHFNYANLSNHHREDTKIYLNSILDRLKMC